jgi:hypothetical protein
MTPNQHTGKLRAIVRGIECAFDGNTWSTPEADGDRDHTSRMLCVRIDLIADLNQATRSTPKTHTGIRDLAEIVLRKLKLWDTAQILSAEQVQKIDDVPPGAIP